MSTFSTARIAGVALTALFFAFTVLARDHSFLNGTWTLAPAKCDFAGQPVMQNGTITIHERDGIIVIERSFVYDGATETVFYKDSIGTENNSTIHNGKDLKTKTRWDHEVLKVTTTRPSGITVESYSLGPDGTLLVGVEKPESKPITLVFQRQ
jgi:hypothetical protein